MKKEQVIQSYHELFTGFEKALNGGAGASTQQLRREAFARFTAEGFPSQRDEDWKYTNLNRIAETAFEAAPETEALTALREEAESGALVIPEAITLFFANGRYVPALSETASLPASVEIRDLRDAIEGGELPAASAAIVPEVLARNAFAELNTAFLRDGIMITVRRGAANEPPIHLLFHSTAAAQPYMTQPRIIVQVESGAECTIIEQHSGSAGAAYFTNAVADIRIADGAIFHHVVLQDESTEASHVSSTFAAIGRAGTYDRHSIGFGAALQRSNIHGVLEGEGAHCTMNGLFLPFGTQHMDHFTTIDHAVANCTSHELYKGVLSDETRGVFTGKIIVRQDAQKTDAKQSNNNLLLSERAQVDTRPQLEIYADDVKCTHGATVGRINEDQLFYLRSRGIGERQALNILTFAFAGDIVSRIPVAALRDALETELHRRLDASWTA